MSWEETHGATFGVAWLGLSLGVASLGAPSMAWQLVLLVLGNLFPSEPLCGSAL